MKKKLFSLLFLSFFLIGSFCSAGDFSIDSRYRLLAPSNCVGGPVISSIGGNLICRNATDCYNEVNCYGGFSFLLPGGLGHQSNLRFYPGDYNITCESYPCYLSFTDGTYFEFNPPLSPNSPLLPGGTVALSGALNNLNNSVGEFIPYIVYIGLGLLLACIGFVAIKRLINWLRNKTLSSFK